MRDVEELPTWKDEEERRDNVEKQHEDQNRKWWKATRAMFTVEQHDKPKQVNKRVSSLKVGRNDPCPCGSGKKFKKCCYTGKTCWVKMGKA